MDSTTFLNKTDAGTWIDTDYILNATAQYVMILFRNESNSSENFSAEDLALLNTCVTFSAEVNDGYAYYYGTQMEIVESISEMSFNPEYAPPGYAAEPFKVATVEGRATCINAVLAVNGGETISLVENLEEVFGSTDLSFAVLEFASSTLTPGNMSFANAKLDTATPEQKAACAGAWLAAGHTLQSSTRYIMIAFKNGEGKVDFTEEQLQVLSQCLTITQA